MIMMKKILLAFGGYDCYHDSVNNQHQNMSNYNVIISSITTATVNFMLFYNWQIKLLSVV